jgi:hypothetical protein
MLDQHTLWNRSTWHDEDPQRLVTWTAVTPPRAVEGPLELVSFRGQVLILELGPDQLACREQDGRLAQVFLDGLHRLEIGESAGQTPPHSRLYFLRLDVPLSWRWQAGCELTVDTGTPEGDRLPLRGACSLHLRDPLRFYTEVLPGLESLDPRDLLAVLDTLVRSKLAAHLEPLAERGRIDRMRAQVQLADLGVEDLDDDLADLGLGCLHLAACIPLEQDEPAVEALVPSALSGSYDDVL